MITSGCSVSDEISKGRDNIDVGDSVDVVYSDQTTTHGIVLHKPQDTGDMWYIRTKRVILALNPNSSGLLLIYREIK